MPLSEGEQKLWDNAVDSLTSDDLDPIQHAARDFRTVRAVSVVTINSFFGRSTDLNPFFDQIETEYMLEPGEVISAFDIAKDRMHGAK